MSTLYSIVWLHIKGNLGGSQQLNALLRKLKIKPAKAIANIKCYASRFLEHPLINVIKTQMIYSFIKVCHRLSGMENSLLWATVSVVYCTENSENISGLLRMVAFSQVGHTQRHRLVILHTSQP